MAERERFTERWHGAIRDWPGPLTLTWGLKDPVARVEVLDGLRELRPGVEVPSCPSSPTTRRSKRRGRSPRRSIVRWLRQDFQRAEDPGVVGVPEAVDRQQTGHFRVQQLDAAGVVGQNLVDVVVEVEILRRRRFRRVRCR